MGDYFFIYFSYIGNNLITMVDVIEHNNEDMIYFSFKYKI